MTNHRERIDLLTRCLVPLMSESPTFYHGETDSILLKADYQSVVGRPLAGDIKACMAHIRRHVTALEAT